MNSWLFLSLILAHVIGDFYLQNDKYCAQKEERKFKSWFLYVHSLIIGVVSWVVVPVYEFRFYALAIAFSHLVIDVIKTYSPKGLWNFVIDQVAHLAVLIIVIFSFDTTTKLPIQSMDCNGSYSIPLFILALLLCIKPANILIKLVLKKYQVGETQSCENIKNAGALIGNLERILTIIFVIIGQYEAIGFIIAAKIHTSIQRHGYSKNRVCPCRNVSKFWNCIAVWFNGNKITDGQFSREIQCACH